MINRLHQLASYTRTHGIMKTFGLLHWRTQAALKQTSWEPWLDGYVPERGRVALDVGANTGQWSIPLAGRFDRVLAFEPNPIAVQQLLKRVPGNVEVYQVALTHKVGTARLQMYNEIELADLNYCTPVSGVKHPSYSLTVATTTIHALQLEDVDFIKIDTEGEERRILLGAEDLLWHCRPRLIVEVHNEDNYQFCTSWLPFLQYNVVWIPFPYTNGHTPGQRYGWIVATPK